MNVIQALLNAGVNGFGVQLVAESFLRSPLAKLQLERGEPLKFFMPIQHSDCPNWKGVEITLAGVAVGAPFEALGAAMRTSAIALDGGQLCAVPTVKNNIGVNEFEAVCTEFLKGCSCADSKKQEECQECLTAFCNKIRSLEHNKGAGYSGYPQLAELYKDVPYASSIPGIERKGEKE